MSDRVLNIGDWSQAERMPYVQRADRPVGAVDRLLGHLYGQLRPYIVRDAASLARITDLVDAHDQRLAAAGSEEMRREVATLRSELLQQRYALAAVGRAFALVREQASRLLGLRHFPVQMQGGLAMLHGMLAEMETGEGKTLTATLPAITMALSGRTVHIVTVNDYLAQRDATLLMPLYEAFGLKVGLVQHGQSPVERRAAYAADIVYCTNKDLVFDYLRDRIALGNDGSRARLLLRQMADGGVRQGDPLLLRGLHFAIVDEADSVLVDEARTPLIIAQDRPGASADLYQQALAMAARLVPGEHYRVSTGERLVRLSPAGKEAARLNARGLTGLWEFSRAREELCEQALSALLLFHRDQHYIVQDGEVRIVDEFTGRVLADRSWERGLHQLIEAKEGCKITGERHTTARMTYQRFFRRYIRLAGMTGTAREVAGEMWSVYGLKIARIATHLPLRRHDAGAALYRSSPDRWQAVVARVKQCALEQGRPVLVGTRSVGASEELSRRLHAAGVVHEVLNARQDANEADLVAQAGQPGRVTVATNMAGRGTDIRLAEGIADKGGLHVILTEFHESARIDRQLYGRAGRQGDPGSYEAIVSAEDELFRVHAPHLQRRVQRTLAPGHAAPRWLLGLLRHAAQGHAERANSRIRRQSVRRDRDLDRQLAFAGRPE